MGWLLRVRRLFVLLLPRRVRRAHGREMERAFLDQVGAARREGGRAAVVRLMAHELADLLWAALRARLPARSASRPGPFSALGWDLRLAFRALRRRAGFAVLVVATIAVAVGGATAMFAVIRGVLLAPLPYPEPDRLAHVFLTNPELGWQRGPVSYPVFRDFRDRSDDVFASLAVYQAGIRATLLTGAEPLRVKGTGVGGEFFGTLGVAPHLGRIPTAAEVEAREPVAVISYGLWRDAYGADPGIVGEPLELEGARHTVVGVMPRDFMPMWSEADLWVPLPDVPQLDDRGTSFLNTIGRLRPGVTLEAAQRYMASLAETIARAEPEGLEGRSMNVEARAETVTSGVRQPIVLLFGAVILLLLVAAANLAGVMLSRGLERRRDLAVRTALGAHRGRLVRELFVESLLLAGAGAVLALPVAALLIDLFIARAPHDVPRLAGVGLDPAALGFGLAVTLATAVGFGLLPALRASRTDPQTDLKGAGARLSDASQRPQRALVVAQVALAAVLLTTAGLLGASLLRLEGVDRGFDEAGVLTFRLAPPRSRYASPEQVDALYAELRDALVALPDVSAVGAAWSLPLTTSFASSSYRIADRPDDEPVLLQLAPVRGDYFRAMDIDLVEGRDFRPGDGATGRPLVTIVNRALAERAWPGERAIGKRLLKDGDEGEPPTAIEVVGVVENAAMMSVGEDPLLVTYWPQAAAPWARDLYMVLRTDGDPLRLAGRVREILPRIDPRLPIAEMTTLAALVDRQLAEPRFRTLLVLGFAALAGGLALLGLYGVVAFHVARRRREVGIRIAIGASPGTVIREVLARGAVLAASGLVLGMVAALGVSRLLEGLLYRVEPAEPALYAGVALALLVAALLASWLPARRAGRVDPVTVLQD